MKIIPLDSAIEDILREDSLARDVRLPETASLVPSDISPEHPLNQILYAQSLEEQMLEHLAPVLVNREITAPSRFRDVARSARDSLRSLAEHLESPEEKEILRKALALLHEQKTLKDVLDSYRQLLVQG